jgi:hypothetical protein
MVTLTLRSKQETGMTTLETYSSTDCTSAALRISAMLLLVMTLPVRRVAYFEKDNKSGAYNNIFR